MKKVAGYLAVGVAVVALGAYAYKKIKEAREVELEKANEELSDIVESFTESTPASEETKEEVTAVAKKVLYKADKFFDVEIRNTMFHKFLYSINKDDRESFTHSYLYMKRELIAKLGKDFLKTRKFIYMLECLVYTMDKKVNRAHPERNILMESVEAVRDEFLLLMENPSKTYFAEADNFANIFIKGEDILKISDSARRKTKLV